MLFSVVWCVVNDGRGLIWNFVEDSFLHYFFISLFQPLQKSFSLGFLLEFMYAIVILFLAFPCFLLLYLICCFGFTVG